MLFGVTPCRYESVIATLCENLDSLDEPEARAAMIWIVGEYAERIDNADELLESFLEGFHDESTQVCFVSCRVCCYLKNEKQLIVVQSMISNQCWQRRVCIFCMKIINVAYLLL